MISPLRPRLNRIGPISDELRIIADDTWHDFDFSPWIGGAGVKGLILEVDNGSGSWFGFRPKGSTSDLWYGYHYNSDTYTIRYVSLDANGVCQFRSAPWTIYDPTNVYIIGTFCSDHFVFFNDPIEISLYTANGWINTDITPHVGADAGNVAYALFFNMGTYVKLVGYRPTSYLSVGCVGNVEEWQREFMMCAVDLNDIFQQWNYTSATLQSRYFLVGYLKRVVNGCTIPITYPSSVILQQPCPVYGTWTDIDLTALLPSCASGVYCAIVNTNTAPADDQTFYIRAKGSINDVTEFENGVFRMVNPFIQFNPFVGKIIQYKSFIPLNRDPGQLYINAYIEDSDPSPNFNHEFNRGIN